MRALIVAKGCSTVTTQSVFTQPGPRGAGYGIRCPFAGPTGPSVVIKGGSYLYAERTCYGQALMTGS